ncbi:TrkA family potassium uptake protein [Actinomadura viridis]|uniref:Trk system potassium uptake protein TrkA n=1 Tax=Actinomadura viridis TaxID=58110 RepID=A0A931DDT2_9ACTN|nr:TrkA family potassium uptake protein [Actinomadura viridis]MBG6089234.1 trk system potassium uptake protein TrkA [Actinomadura viridis]
MADIENDPVVVVGLGRFGTSLALELARRGTEVLAIDKRSKIVQSLSGRLTHIVAADATDIDTLRELGVAEFYRAVVAIGGDLEASILSTALLVELGIDDIWTKAVSRQHARILERIGAHHIVLPEQDMGERVAHLVSGRMLDYVEVDDNFALVKTRPPREIVGTPLGDTRLRSKHGVTVVCVKRPDEDFTYASADTVLEYGDVILVAGPIAKVERFAERA